MSYYKIYFDQYGRAFENGEPCSWKRSNELKLLFPNWMWDQLRERVEEQKLENVESDIKIDRFIETWSLG